MKLAFTNDYVQVDITSKLVRYRARGARRWIVVFNGKNTAERFDLKHDVARQLLKAGFDDDVAVILYEAVKSGAIYSVGHWSVTVNF